MFYSLIYDTLDSHTDPHAGIYTKVTQEFAGVGGDVTFLRTTGSASYYRELLPDRNIVGLIKVQGGDIFGIGEDVRLLDAFFKGAPNAVRQILADYLRDATERGQLRVTDPVQAATTFLGFLHGDQQLKMLLRPELLATSDEMKRYVEGVVRIFLDGVR